MFGEMGASTLPQILAALVLWWDLDLEVLEFHLGIMEQIGAPLLFQLKVEGLLLAILVAAWVMGMVTAIIVLVGQDMQETVELVYHQLHHSLVQLVVMRGPMGNFTVVVQFMVIQLGELQSPS
jgi:hypothetical protein